MVEIVAEASMEQAPQVPRMQREAARTEWEAAAFMVVAVAEAVMLEEAEAVMLEEAEAAVTTEQ